MCARTPKRSSCSGAVGNPGPEPLGVVPPSTQIPFWEGVSWRDGPQEGGIWLVFGELNMLAAGPFGSEGGVGSIGEAP